MRSSPSVITSVGCLTFASCPERSREVVAEVSSHSARSQFSAWRDSRGVVPGLQDQILTPCGG